MLRFLFPALMLAAIVVAGCGGKSGGPVLPLSSATPGQSADITPGTTPQTVALAYAGFAVQMTVPASYAGSGTIAATAQTAPPSGVSVPSFEKRAILRTAASAVKKPKSVGSAVTTLIYVVVQPSATVQFTSIPSFTFTLPAGTAIPSGDPSYIAYYGPTQQSANNGWIGVLGPGVVSGQTDTFTGVSGGVTFVGGQTYVFALVYTTQAVATASPAPTPTAVATTAAIPAYCSNYVASPAVQPGLYLNITDSSNLPGAALLVYVQQQAQPSPQPSGVPIYPNIAWMDQNGNFGSSPVALPAACYSTTVGSGVKNNPLVVPVNHAGRIYFVYVKASGSVPNPFATMPPFSTPTSGVFNPFGYWLYDKIEFNSTSGVIDTTQVDFLGLPLEMSVSGPTATPLPAVTPASNCGISPPLGWSSAPTEGSIVGVSQCGFANVFNGVAADTNYQSTVVRVNAFETYGSAGLTPDPSGGGPIIDYRVDSPNGSRSFNFFDWDLLGDGTVSVNCPIVSGDASYLNCIMAEYHQTPVVYNAKAALGGNGDDLNFCVSSDGSTKFEITAIGTATSCTATPMPVVAPHAVPSSNPPSPSNPNPLPASQFSLPAALFTYAAPSTTPTACQYSLIFAAPFGNAYVDAPQSAGTGGNLFATSDAFTLWKALVVEMNYGTALQPASSYPLESTPPVYTSEFKDVAFNDYANYIHEWFDGKFAYAQPYDDAFNWYSGYSITSPASVNVRINPIPTAAPTGAPGTSNAAPTPCNTVAPEVGTYQ